MFYGCFSIEEINFSNKDIFNVTSIDNLFSLCSSLKSIDLSNIYTSNTEDMDYMFED